MQPIQLGAPSPTGLPRTWKPPCPFGEHHLRMLERRNGGDASSDDDDDVGAEAAVDDDDVRTSALRLIGAIRRGKAREVGVDLKVVGLPASVAVRDLWSRSDAGRASGRFAVPLPPHGAGLYRLRG